MEGMLRKATLLIAFSLLLVFFGCPQEAVEEEPRGEPPFMHDPLSYMYDELVQTPSDYDELFGCTPPEMEDHCEGKTRYYNFECVNGNWEYEMEECTYGCEGGVCVISGCPPCDDGNPCTMDLCSGAPDYECLHIPIPGCVPEDAAISSKACVPTAGPGSYIKLAVYPASAPSDYKGEPYISQTLRPGERVWVDSTNWISLDGFWLEGTCPACFREPVLKWPPQAKITVNRDLSGSRATSFRNEGEVGYICIQGTCRSTFVGRCIDYSCNSTMRFVISEVDVKAICS